MSKGKIGIDEAGRGPLAGPVAVGLFYLLPNQKISTRGLKDSKKLSERDRELWFDRIREWQKEGKAKYAVQLVANSVIDSKGIVRAISIGLEQCLKSIGASRSTEIFLDGGLRAPKQFSNQETIVRGDEKISVISLASIAAKVTRDRYMVRLSKKYPKYSFEKHKGYGTTIHRLAIKKYGSSKIHRKTFIKNFDK